MREKKWLYIKSTIVAAVAILLVLTAVLLNIDRTKRIYFTEEKIELDVNTAMNLAPVLSPVGINRNRINYVSGDESIAGYDNDVIIAKTVGECTVYAECDGVVSNVVYVSVRDYAEEALEISRDIDEYIWSGNMSEYKADALYSRLATLPEYARESVENAWKLYIYRDFPQGNKAVYISRNSGKYHLNSYCVKGLIQVPFDIAKGEKLSPCSRCAE